MLGLKEWTGEALITKDFKLLLAIGAMYSLSVALSNTFVNVYIWKLTASYLQIGIYNLMIVIAQPVCFVFAGWIAKRVDRIVVFRVGVALLAIYYFFILWTGERATAFLWLIGFLLGMGYGFYWLAYNVLTFEITEPETRDFFNGLMGILTSFGSMAGPLIAGFIISRLGQRGYHHIFSLSLFLFALATICSFFMKNRSARGPYQLLTIMKERSQNRNWYMITNASLAQGLREGIFAFLINLHVYLVGKSEWALGKFAFINSFVSMVAYYLVARFIKQTWRKQAILFGGITLFFAVFLIVIRPSLSMFIVYGIVISLAYPLVLIPYISTLYDVIGSSREAGEWRVEYIVVRELFLNLGRAFSIITFLITCSFLPAERIIPYLLVIFGAGYLFIYFFVARIANDFMNG